MAASPIVADLARAEPDVQARAEGRAAGLPEGAAHGRRAGAARPRSAWPSRADPQDRRPSGRGCGSGSRRRSSTSRPASAASRPAAIAARRPNLGDLLAERGDWTRRSSRTSTGSSSDFDDMLDRLVSEVGSRWPVELVVEIVGDARSLEQAFKKSSKSANTFGRSMEKTQTKSQACLRRHRPRSPGFAAGCVGTAGLSASPSAAFAELLGGAEGDARRRTRSLKSTGGAANVTAKQSTSWPTRC